MLQLVERVRALESREKYGAASQLSTPGARHQRNQSTPWRSLQSAERHARSAAGATDAEYRDCSCGRTVREAQSGACEITTLASSAHGCLTPRSSGAPTAGHASHQALGLRPILRLLSGASCRCRPLSSNVRPHNPRSWLSTRLTLCTRPVIIAARAYPKLQVQRHPRPL